MHQQQWVYQVTRSQIAAVTAAIVIAAMILPVGVMAATGTFVNIRDYSNTGTSGKARVVNNKLAVEVCDVGTTAVSTSACARVSGGKLQVAEMAPSTAFSVAIIGDQVLQDVVPGFTSGKLMITSFTFTHSYGSPAYSWIYKYTDNTCSTLDGYFVYAAAQSATTESLSFPTPLIVTQRCAHVWAGGYGLVIITGYRVP